MTRTLRSIILTLVFIIVTMLALLLWFGALQSAFPSMTERPSPFGAFEQYIALAVGAPVLLSAGAVAYLLYEQTHRNTATLAFALITGALLAWLAPTFLLGGRAWLLVAYWLSCAALGSGFVLLGAWCAALVRKHRHRPANEA